MNHPRLSDAEREALQDEYSVMPAAISDEGISRQAMDRVVEMAKGYLKERDVAREALRNYMGSHTAAHHGIPCPCGICKEASKALSFRADGDA